MVQVIDISGNICYDLQRADNKFLSLINGCISHELRNPLNALKALKMKMQSLQKKLNMELLALGSKVSNQISNFISAKIKPTIEVLT